MVLGKEKNFSLSLIKLAVYYVSYAKLESKIIYCQMVLESREAYAD